MENKKKRKRKIRIDCIIKDVAVGFLYGLPIFALVMSLFRVGLAENELYLDFINRFNFNFIYDTLVSILGYFNVTLTNSYLGIVLSVFSWFVFVGLLDCVYDLFEFLIDCFQSFIHRGY